MDIRQANEVTEAMEREKYCYYKRKAICKFKDPSNGTLIHEIVTVLIKEPGRDVFSVRTSFGELIKGVPLSALKIFEPETQKSDA